MPDDKKDNPESSVSPSGLSPASSGASDNSHPIEKPRYHRPKLVVDILEAKPNKMFSEAHRQLVRFLRYQGAKVACAECGKKKSTLWTMLCSFQAWDMARIVPKKSGKIHMPMVPVCQTHLLAAEMDEVDEQGNAVAAQEGTL